MSQTDVIYGTASSSTDIENPIPLRIQARRNEGMVMSTLLFAQGGETTSTSEDQTLETSPPTERSLEYKRHDTGK
jgi:hypothetical protein